MNHLQATVISLFPMQISQPKPGMYPGYFVIPPAPLGDISYLLVGDSIYYVDTVNNQKAMMTVPFYTVAQSVVTDFMNSHVGTIPEVAEPGLFWVQGGYEEKEEIIYVFKNEIARAEERQLKWFTELVKMADDQYARVGRHTAVSDLQRHAVERLGLQRPYMLRLGDAGQCKFCKVQVPYGAVKCPNCREIIDQVGYDRLIQESA